MTFKEKFMFIFLQIITLGLIWIYWRKKAKKYNAENELSVSNTSNINIIKLINYLGGINNIESVSTTHTKVKINYLVRERVEVAKIKEQRGISGVFINDKSITIIVGNSANYICKSIKEHLNN